MKRRWWKCLPKAYTKFSTIERHYNKRIKHCIWPFGSIWSVGRFHIVNVANKLHAGRWQKVTATTTKKLTINFQLDCNSTDSLNATEHLDVLGSYNQIQQKKTTYLAHITSHQKLCVCVCDDRTSPHQFNSTTKKCYHLFKMLGIVWTMVTIMCLEINFFFQWINHLNSLNSPPNWKIIKQLSI